MKSVAHLTPVRGEVSDRNAQRFGPQTRMDAHFCRGLKIPRRKACRFDSGPGHHVSRRAAQIATTDKQRSVAHPLREALRIWMLTTPATAHIIFADENAVQHHSQGRADEASGHQAGSCSNAALLRHRLQGRAWPHHGQPVEQEAKLDTTTARLHAPALGKPEAPRVVPRGFFVSET